MNKIEDENLVKHYLQEHQLVSIFSEELIPYMSLYHFEEGELICSQGESFQYLYFLVKGKVKIYNTSAEGKTLILSFKNPIEVIGDIEYIQKINSINSVEAVSSVYMISVHHSYLNTYAKDYAPFLQFLLQIITQKFHLKSNSLSLSILYPVEVRLASYLLSVTHDENNSPLNEQVSTPSNLTDIADLIGTSYRHLNRVIHRLSEDGLIVRSKEGIMIKNREGLHSISSRNIYE